MAPAKPLQPVRPPETRTFRDRDPLKGRNPQPAAEPAKEPQLRVDLPKEVNPVHIHPRANREAAVVQLNPVAAVPVLQ